MWQAFAKHMHGIDWNYHHCLGLINCTSFLLNYLADVIDGAQSYGDWINGDLYERTEECFSICTLPGISHFNCMFSVTNLNIWPNIPDALRTRLAMQPYNEQTARLFNVSSSDDWLRHKQGLALPAIPPTTSEARWYFFVKIREYAVAASASGQGTPDYEAFA